MRFFTIHLIEMKLERRGRGGGSETRVDNKDKIRIKLAWINIVGYQASECNREWKHKT